MSLPHHKGALCHFCGSSKQTGAGQRLSGSRSWKPWSDKETWVKMKILPLHCKTVKPHTCSAMLPKLSREFWRLYQLKRFFGSQGKQYYFCATSTLAGFKIKLFWQDHRVIFYLFTEVTRLLSNSFSGPLPAKLGRIWCSYGWLSVSAGCGETAPAEFWGASSCWATCQRSDRQQQRSMSSATYWPKMWRYHVRRSGVKWTVLL